MNSTQNLEFLNDFEFDKFVDFIRKNQGIDLSFYRKSFVLRRLRLRMSQTESENYLDYVNCIKKVPEEFSNFLDALGINVTEFFRDPEVFAAFKEKTLAELISRKESSYQSTIRIWSAACASGEEAYSLAITVKEALERTKKVFKVGIWATDMDSDALSKAKKAEYKAFDLRKLDKKILEKYFIPAYNSLYNLKEEVKQMVTFQRHNLITDEPLNFMDVIFCRNMMIYLNRQQQEAMAVKFHHGLNSKGYLVVGKVESVWGKDLFKLVETREKIYQKI
ncbi:MAG: protein-glutamate O-methyltransferase CheR [Candidatus Omnitrophica bacterium]|nr:protein-glutamate O-methyltransferase CheR [Candidatus Omnitrophota bacterium]